MNAQSSSSWLVPSLLGALVGAIVVGAPLWYYAADQRAQLFARSAKVAQLQGEKAQLQAAAQQLQTERDASRAQAQTEQMEIQAQQARAAELAKPDLPVRVHLRRSLLGAGMVLTVQNISDSDLPVMVIFGRAGTPAQTRELVIPRNGLKEIGEQQGWAFVAGDSVVLRNPTFREWANPSLPAR